MEVFSADRPRIPETPSGPAPLDMILVHDSDCAEQLGTVITVIIDEVVLRPPYITGTGKKRPVSESMTKIFPNSVDITVQALTFESFIHSLRSRILMIFLEIEQDLPVYWLRDKLPERRINSIEDLADVVLGATDRTKFSRSPNALSSYGIDGQNMNGLNLYDCDYALFESRAPPADLKAKEWIQARFTVQDKPVMTIFLQKDANDQIPLDVSAKMTLGDVRQKANLRSGRFTFSDQEYTEKDDNTALADLGVSAQSLLGFISWLGVTVQIDAFYFYPSQMTPDAYDHSVSRAADVYWDFTHLMLEDWKLPIIVELRGPGSTFQSFTDLLRSHILNNMMDKLPLSWRRDEIRADKHEDVFLSVTRGTEPSTVWALKKHGIGMDLEGDQEIWRCGNGVFQSRADDRKEYAHVVFSVKDS